MIVNETAINQIVKKQIIKLLQFTIQPSTMDKNPYRKGKHLSNILSKEKERL